MRWLWFVAAIALLAITFRTHSMGLAAVCLLGTLVCLLMGTLALASRRIEGRSRDAESMMGPDELRRLREQAEKRKLEGSGGTAAASGAAGSKSRYADDDQDVDSVSSSDGGSSD